MIILHGNDKINHDGTRSQMKYIPMPGFKVLTTRLLPSSSSVNNTCNRTFIYFSLRNLRSPSAIIHYKNIEDSKTYDIAMIEILKNFSNEDRQLPDFLRCGFTWKEEERRQKYSFLRPKQTRETQQFLEKV